MKKKYMKLIGSIVLAFCLVATGVVATINAQAEGEETLKDVKYSEAEVAYVEDATTLSGDGYLFAGWYTKNEAGGLGGKISPSAVLVIQNGKTRLVNIKNQDTITKLLDLIPDIMDRVSDKKEGKVTEKDIDEMLDEAEKK